MREVQEAVMQGYMRPTRHQVDKTGVAYIGQGNVLRYISPEARQETLELLNSQLFVELVEKKLFPSTRIVEESSDKLVLQHDKAAFVIYPGEWSFSMLKKAVLTLLYIAELCGRHGWYLQDGHLWNMVFFGGSPMLVDFGSLKKGEQSTTQTFYWQALVYAFLPLLLWSEGDFYLANRLLTDTYPRRLQPFPSIGNTPIYQNRLKMFRRRRGLPYWSKLACNLCMLPFPPLRKYQ